MEANGMDALLGCKANDPELKRVLKMMDELLGILPKEEIEAFSKTKDYELYRKVLSRYGVE
jgi:hypothetical protein